jgi:hypothetical protein
MLEVAVAHRDGVAKPAERRLPALPRQGAGPSVYSLMSGFRASTTS